MPSPLVPAALKGIGMINNEAKARPPLEKKHKRDKQPASSSPSSFPPLNPSDLIELEHETWRAQQESGGALLPYLSPDCVLMLPMGLQVSQQSTPNIEDILTSAEFVPWESYKLAGITVTEVGAGGAVVSYRVRAKKHGTPLFRALVTSVWRRESRDEGADGKWFMCAHQQTPFEHGVEGF